ncbi:MAG: hypothetical protein AAB845_02335 [Patescibacteria group bacterium]
MNRYLTVGVLVFFVFVFALTLGATLNERQTRLAATTHCQNTGGVWSANDYCEKTVSVCEPQAL